MASMSRSSIVSVLALFGALAAAAPATRGLAQEPPERSPEESASAPPARPADAPSGDATGSSESTPKSPPSGQPSEHGGMHAHHRFTDTERWVRMFEDPKRAEYQKPAEVVAALKLKPGQAVGDIGAGSGYFAFPIAGAVGPAGKVYAIDIEPGMLSYITERSKHEKVANVVPVLGSSDDAHLSPGSVDLIFICNTIHHIEHRVEYYRRLAPALRSGGRIAVIDYHKRPLPVGPDVASKIDRGDVVKEFVDAGFALVEEPTFLPYQYFLIFAKAPS